MGSFDGGFTDLVVVFLSGEAAAGFDGDLDWGNLVVFDVVL